MAIQDDFTINYATKKVSHTAGATRYTVNALYSWLMDTFDELGQLDDDVPMKANTPTEYEMINGWTFDSDADVGYLFGGSIKVNAPDDLWANFYTLGSIEAGTVLYVEQDGALVAAYPGYTDGHIDQLVKVRATGADVNARTITVFGRNPGDTYDHFEIAAPATGGRNPVPVATAADTNDDESGASIVGVTVAFGAAQADVDANGTPEDYSVTVDGGGNTILDVYRRLKYLTQRENTDAIDSPENMTEGRFYRAAGAFTEVKQAPFGTFAGGKFFGAPGVLVTNISDANNIVLKDDTGTLRTPPTSITIKVDAIVAGDRVFVARTSGGVVNKSQFTAAGAHNASDTLVVNEVVGNDIPSSGAIRVGDVRYTYSGLNRATKTFSGVTPAVSCANAAPLYVPVVDEVATGTSISKSIVYAADFPVKTRVRRYGGAGNSILPFEVDGTVSVVGLTVTAIRTADTVVS